MISLPPGWASGNIRRFATMKTGHTPSRSDAEYWDGGEIPWFTLADVWQLRDDRRIYLGNPASSITEEGLANSAAELLPSGTVVLSRTASVGFSGVMPRPMATSQDFWNWVCGPELLPEYLNYQLKSLRGHLRSLNMGSTHQTIYQRDAASLHIFVPPLDEQRAIADYLDRETAQIDTLIEEQLRLAALLRERKSAVLDRTIAEVSSSGVRARLKHVVSAVRQGWSPQAHPWPADGVQEWGVLKAGAVNLGAFRSDENKALPDDEEPRPELTVKRDQIVVSRANTRDLVGSAALIEQDFPRLMLCDKLYAFDVDQTLADPSFVSKVLNTRRYRGLLEIEATGSSHSMQNISLADLMNLPLALPGLNMQREAAAAIDAERARIDLLIAETERFIELSRERRTALITAAVTGELTTGSR